MLLSELSPALEALLLVTALSVDAFVASFAYGANKIRIPLSSVAVINLICSLILGLALFLGFSVRPWLPDQLTKWFCFSILLVLGIAKLFDSSLKALIRRHSSLHKQIRFSFLHLGFILHIYADPPIADADDSRVLSPAEAASLALAVSLDGLAVGFGAGLGNAGCLEAVLFSLLLGAGAVICGSRLGCKAADRFSLDLSWLGGLLLILLALMKL